MVSREPTRQLKFGEDEHLSSFQNEKARSRGETGPGAIHCFQRESLPLNENDLQDFLQLNNKVQRRVRWDVGTRATFTVTEV
jgi:hypothetical protein